MNAENPQIELARRYVELTGVSIFLTGKAGTGKTTFLRDVAAHCPKRHAVVAPTGVAAINAGGVTIHSFFQLPFDPYLPDVKELLTEYQMPDKFKSLNKTKINILRTLELLIIDEISMVRADLLDAIDMTLRRYRRNSQPFGGVQLLMIGDVHQLSPVVTEAERPYMERVYPSPYFFSSKALQRMTYVTIELTTVYRQQDAAFVDLLNHVRDNDIDATTLATLNSRVDSRLQMASPSDDKAITLTTHNRQADAINQRHLRALKGESRTFEASVSGSFPEKSFPCDRFLELKIGERVMFIKNDSSGSRLYYNGKLGTVSQFVKVDGKEMVEVTDDDGEAIVVGHERWENMKYSIDSRSNEIVQEVDGTFEQYPLQAAWAVTIHKAQGLTFDRVVIDAADAFAFGQVYVALSRCRTLEGLTLSTPLTASVAFDDAQVSGFVNSRPSFEQTAEVAASYEKQYRIERLMELFGIDSLLHLAETLQRHYVKLKNLYPTQLSVLNSLLSTLIDLQSVSERFKSQLMRLDEAGQNERARQGATYYLSKLSPMNEQLDTITHVEIDNKENRKEVSEAGKQLAEALSVKTACLNAVATEGYSVHIVGRAKANQLIANAQPESKSKKGASYTTGKRPAGTADEADSDLMARLRYWRMAKANEDNVPAYIILQQKALISIAESKPQTPAELGRLAGVGPKTVEKYGDEILAIVGDFLDEKRVKGEL